MYVVFILPNSHHYSFWHDACFVNICVKGDWKFDVYLPVDGLDILDNAKNFRSHVPCLARSSIGMSADTGVYAIKMKMNDFDGTYGNGIGVCLKDVDLGDEWWSHPEHFVWGQGMWYSFDWIHEIPRNGFNFSNHLWAQNVFHEKCEIAGDVPPLEENDEIEMTYDSNRGEMRFKKNGENLGVIVHNLKCVGDLYWCVGLFECRRFVDVSIID